MARLGGMNRKRSILTLISQIHWRSSAAVAASQIEETVVTKGEIGGFVERTTEPEVMHS